MSEIINIPKSNGADDHPKRIGQYQILDVKAFSERSALYLAANESEEEVWLMALPKNTAHEHILNFKRRLETLTHLNHPSLPEIVDFRTRKNSHAFATIAYQSLTSLYHRYHMDQESTKPLLALDALGTIRQIAEVLNILHPAGLVHNDLHPQRLFFDEADRFLIIDAALPFIQINELYIGENITYLPYASPEEREGKSITARGNIYSLGVLLYQLLAGHPPRLPLSEWDIFEYKALPREIPLEQAVAGLTSETYELVRNCLWQKEWSRYETMEQLIAAIDIATAAEKIGPPRPNFFVQYKKWLMVGIPVLVLILSFVLFMLFRG